jgi:hypothetical protein
LWIADSSARLHATASLSGTCDLQLCKVNIIIGDGKTTASSQMGKKHLKVKQPNNKNKILILQEVHYVPDLKCNLFSLAYEMSNSAEISSSDLELTIKKGSWDIFLIKSSEVKMVTYLQSRHFQF